MLNMETVCFVGLLNELAKKEKNGFVRIEDIDENTCCNNKIIVGDKYDAALGGYMVVKKYALNGNATEPLEYYADEELGYTTIAVKGEYGGLSTWIVYVKFADKKTTIFVHDGSWSVIRAKKLEKEETFDPYRSVEDFFKEENRYRGGIFDKTLYDALCERYGFVKAHFGWERTDDMQRIPDTVNRGSLINGPDIRRYFDHLYTFKTEDGTMYWVVCPYLKGGYADNLSAVKGLFEANALKCDIYAGFYNRKTATIVLKPEDVAAAYGV